MYHQTLHDTKKRGIEIGEVKLNLTQMMKAKDESVSSLTKGIEFLFKKNKVDYIKGTGAFASEHEIRVNLVDGGETSVRGKNVIIATGSESTPFPGLEIDETKVVTSTGAIALKEVPKRMAVIGGGIIGLEMVIQNEPMCWRFGLTDITGIRMVTIRFGGDSGRIPRTNRRTRYGC